MQPLIKDVRLFSSKRSWKTKSDGELRVLFQIPHEEARSYLETAHFPSPDIRGLRAYMVDGLMKGKVGGKEFHKIRKEFFSVTRGSLDLEVRDLQGNIKTYHLGKGECLFIPPYILHTYTVKEDSTSFVVVASTTFNPDDEGTHDTYAEELFFKMQGKKH